MLKSTKSKLLIYIVPFIIAVLFGTYLLYINVIENMMFDRIELKIEADKGKQETQIEDSLIYFRKTMYDLSLAIGSTYEHETLEDYRKILSKSVVNKDYLLGIGIWFKPNVFDKNNQYMGVYVDKFGESGDVDNPLEVDRYDYFRQNSNDSISSVKDNNYIEINFDETINDYVITSISPIFNDDNEIIGFITADFDTSKMKDIIQEFNTETMKVFILDENGTYISDEDHSLVVNHSSVFDDTSEFSNIASHIVVNEYGSHIYTKSDEKYYLYFDTFSDFKWKIVYIMPEKIISNTIEKVTIFYLIGSIAMVMVLSIIVMLVMNRIIHKPINLLLKEFEEISNNTYTTDVAEELLNNHDEFGKIGNSLKSMKISLREYQKNLERKNKLLSESEKNTREAMEYSDAIIKAMPQLLFVVTKEGYCIDCRGSQVFATKTKESYIGRHIKELMSEADAKTFINILSDIKEGESMKGVQVSVEVEGVREYFMLNVSYCRENEIVVLSNRVTELQRQLENNYFLSYNDQLTGLCNRRSFENTLEKFVDEGKYPISFIVSDINGLKMVNDSFGHEKGDELLLKYADALKKLNLKHEYVSRIGGDEFAIILPFFESEEASQIRDKLSSYCSEEFINGVELSVSFGVATMYDSGESINEVLKVAEDKMYQQKIYVYASRKDNTIEIINNTLHAKNKREQLHSNRVAELAERTAKCLGMNVEEQNKIRTAGLMHDIGKIGIPEELLNKPADLTEEEYKEVAKHPEIGYRILKASGKMLEIADCVLSHHEKWDGTGYPRGIKGEEISLEARIIAIADTYDAMTNQREYRRGLSKEVAIAELIKYKGTQFDPNLVDVFVNEVLKNL